MEKSPNYKSINAELLRRAAKGIFGMKKEIDMSKSITKERKKLGNLNISNKIYELNNNKIEIAKFGMPRGLECLLLNIEKSENNVPIRRELAVCRETTQDLYEIIIAYECDTCRQVLGEREAYIIINIKKDNPINIVKIVPNPYKDKATVESIKLKFSDKSKVFPYLVGSRLFETMNRMGEATLFFENSIKNIPYLIQRLNDRLRSLLLEVHGECDKMKNRTVCYFVEDVLKDYLLNYHSIYRNIL